MTYFLKTRSAKIALRLALVSGAAVALSGCYSSFGENYYDTGYNSYSCDPYSQFDTYYSCDYGYGFYNIGYTGGWYNSYWYPGYGIYLFDNYGRRFDMDDRYRHYWAQQRNQWQRSRGGYEGGEHRGNYGGGYQGGQGGHDEHRGG